MTLPEFQAFKIVKTDTIPITKLLEEYRLKYELTPLPFSEITAFEPKYNLVTLTAYFQDPFNTNDSLDIILPKRFQFGFDITKPWIEFFPYEDMEYYHQMMEELQVNQAHYLLLTGKNLEHRFLELANQNSSMWVTTIGLWNLVPHSFPAGSITTCTVQTASEAIDRAVQIVRNNRKYNPNKKIPPRRLK
jgi:hypothetical protein